MTDHDENLRALAVQLAALDGMTVPEALERLMTPLAYILPIPDGRPVWPPAKAQPDEIATSVKLPPTWAPENTGGECRCGTPTRDDRYVCDPCADLLTQALNETPWAVEQLDISITRQRAVTYDGTGGAGLNWHDRAATLQRTLNATLSQWVRYCTKARIRHSSPLDGLPNDTPAAKARWLLWRVDALTLNARGPEAVEEIVEQIAEARRVVLWKRRNQIYLGPCTFHDICAGEVYADEDATIGACDQCQKPYPVAETRTALEQELDDRLFTAAEIAHLTTYLGINKPRENIRKLVNKWHQRGLLKGTPIRDTEGKEIGMRFRYGDVAPRLSATYSKGAAS